MNEQKKRQIVKVAKELEISTAKILDHIRTELPETDITKGISAKIDDTVYRSLLKKFSPEAYKEYVDEDKPMKEVDEKVAIAQKKQADIKSRISEVDEILSTTDKGETEEKTQRRSKRRIKEEVQLAVPEIEKAVEKEQTPAVSEKAENEKKKDDHAENTKRLKIKKRAADTTGKKRADISSKDKSAAIEKTLPETVSDKSDADRKGKKVKKTDSRESIKDDKSQKGKAVFKRRRHKKVSVIVADGGVVETAEEPVSKSKKRKKRDKVSQEDVKDSVKETLSKMSADGSKSFKKKKKKKAQEDGSEVEIEVNVINVSEFISTSELANKLGLSVTDIITKCFSMGMMITINQRLDRETIELICTEFDAEAEFESEYDEDFFVEDDNEDPAMLEGRNPIITVMGHVDHGKTSLLDYIRKTKVVSGESGGITQHIGAYVVEYNTKHLSFLDTPGHEAFTAMRARGAKVTDIVIIVIAADDRVNAQTNEAIDHALLAEVPIIFAINKMDRPSADPEKIRTQLSQRNILVEQWGGNYQSVEISAITGQGINDLLDAIVLESDMLELKANPSCQALGTVLESKLDKGFGAVSTVLVQKGTLKVGDVFVCGQTYGKVRAMMNERRENMQSAGPSYPAMVLGFTGSANAGDLFIVVDNEQKARSIASRREQINRAQAQHKIDIVTLDNVSEQIKLGDVKNLNLIIKADADGSVEAIRDTLMKMANKEVAVKILSKGVGAITEGDVLLAEASGSVIMGFHVRPNPKAKELAAQKKVEIRIYSIIYDLFADVKNALEGMLKPLVTEELLGTAEVRVLFKVPKMGTIAGSYVQSGKVIRNALLKVVRDGIEVYQGKLNSLKRVKDDAKEVVSGYECGIGIENFNDFKENDIIEVFEYKETQRKLEV